MKTLWFKAEFVAAILSGNKTDTMRVPSSRLPSVGDRVALSVGPRPPFAVATITGVSRIALSRLSAVRRAQVLACYSPPPAHLVRIEFALDRDTAGSTAQPTATGRSAP